MNNSLHPDITTSQDLSADPLSYTTSIGRRFKLEKITFHFSGASTETITITLDSAKGANYDVVLRAKSLSAETDYVYIPDGDAKFYKGDEIKVQCTNAGITTVYVAIKTSEILI